MYYRARCRTDLLTCCKVSFMLHLADMRGAVLVCHGVSRAHLRPSGRKGGFFPVYFAMQRTLICTPTCW